MPDRPGGCPWQGATRSDAEVRGREERGEKKKKKKGWPATTLQPGRTLVFHPRGPAPDHPDPPAPLGIANFSLWSERRRGLSGLRSPERLAPVSEAGQTREREDEEFLLFFFFSDGWARAAQPGRAALRDGRRPTAPQREDELRTAERICLPNPCGTGAQTTPRPHLLRWARLDR